MKIAKLFQNGQSQAVRLPKEFRFEGGHCSSLFFAGMPAKIGHNYIID